MATFSIVMDLMISIAAWAAFGRTIPSIGWACPIPIARWPTALAARQDSAAPPASGALKAFTVPKAAGLPKEIVRRVVLNRALDFHRGPLSKITALLAVSRTEAPRACKATTDFPAWDIPASAVAADSVVAAEAEGFTVAAEAGDKS
jgi:hypothetical protein